MPLTQVDPLTHTYLRLWGGFDRFNSPVDCHLPESSSLNSGDVVNLCERDDPQGVLQYRAGHDCQWLEYIWRDSWWGRIYKGNREEKGRGVEDLIGFENALGLLTRRHHSSHVPEEVVV
jgi:hypothetical protein